MFRINEITQSTSFPAWFLLLSVIPERLRHVVAYHQHFILFYDCFSAWMYCILFIHSSTEGHLNSSHLLATVNNTAMNIQIQVFLGTYISSLAGDISRSGTAGSHG